MQVVRGTAVCYNARHYCHMWGSQQHQTPYMALFVLFCRDPLHIWVCPKPEAILHCPYCHHPKTNVIDTNHDARGGTRRRRVCDNCGQRFSSYERPVLATPLLVKQDNTREEFSREKLMGGLRIACAKRPVAAADIERIAGEVEAELQQLGKAEVSSKFVGDSVIEKLKELDEVAYIRYVTVYMNLDDLEAIRKEIDRLRATK